jgi:hypothetical protein
VFLAAIPAIIGPIISAASTAVMAVAGPLATAGSMLWSGLGAVGGLVGMTAGQTAMVAGSLVGTAVSTATSVVQGKTQNKIADQQADMAQQEADFQKGQANVRLEQEKTQLGEKRVAIARQAAQERGAIQASGLPVQSIRALVRNVEASRGRGDIGIRTNLEFAQQRQAAAHTAKNIGLAGAQLQIAGSRVNNIGLSAFGTAVGGLVGTGEMAMGFDAPSTGGSATAGGKLRSTAGRLDAGSSAISTGF